MEELLELTGHYNLQLSFNEDEREIYASSKTATSVLVEDLKKLKEVTGAEKAELYAYNDSEEDNFVVSLELPEKKEETIDDTDAVVEDEEGRKRFKTTELTNSPSQ